MAHFWQWVCLMRSCMRTLANARRLSCRIIHDPIQCDTCHVLTCMRPAQCTRSRASTWTRCSTSLRRPRTMRRGTGCTNAGQRLGRVGEGRRRHRQCRAPSSRPGAFGTKCEHTASPFPRARIDSHAALFSPAPLAPACMLAFRLSSGRCDRICPAGTCLHACSSAGDRPAWWRQACLKATWLLACSHRADFHDFTGTGNRICSCVSKM